MKNVILRLYYECPTPKKVQAPTNLESYEGSMVPQEHMDAFKYRMTLARASDLIKFRAFPITLKKMALKWFNSLPLRSINKFSDLASQFLAIFHYYKVQAKIDNRLARSIPTTRGATLKFSQAF